MMPRPIVRKSRRRAVLLAGCALGAALPLAAGAQSFQGTPDVVTGAAEVAEGSGTTEVLLFTPETVINWTAVDTGGGAIDFQPAGTTATFFEGITLGEYTVLNRILPVDTDGQAVAATVAFNGAVSSTLGGVQGGNVWFYSPTGIIVGPDAAFNVGSLILTTNDIQYTANIPNGPDGSIYGAGGLVSFVGQAGSTGFVEVMPGASLVAGGIDSYVALVAPRVVQGGTVSAARDIAYIAAEQVDMTINAGLFDFAVTVGTTDANGVVHTGDTTGTASTGFADTKRIAMIAVPKNDALTMLLSGSIGYAPAADAFNDGSAVVLASGFDTVNPSAFPANELGSIEIGNSQFRNRLTAYASDAIDVQPQGGTAAFGGSTSFYAGNSISLAAQGGESVAAALDLYLSSGKPGTGGTIDITASGGGSISANDYLYLNASSSAASYDYDTQYLDAEGGAVNLLADGGTIATNGTLAIVVEGSARAEEFVGGGTGRGGSIGIAVAGGGSISADSVQLYAGGYGGNFYDGGGPGGDGSGGAISLRGDGGQLAFLDVYAFAGGRGGYGDDGGGDGLGGTIAIDILGAAQNWASLTANADGEGGYADGEILGGVGGSPADAISLTVAGPGSLAVERDIVLSANAYSADNVAEGSIGQAGGIALRVADGGELSANAIVLSADARIVRYNLETASTPIQRGGAVSVVADGGTLTTSYLNASASAYGLAATISAGSATGGTVQATALGGGTIFIDGGDGGMVVLDGGEGSAIASGLELYAHGYGAPGAVASDAFGGTATLIAEDGAFEVLGHIVVSASAQANTDGNEAFATPPRAGPSAIGGNAGVELRAGTLGTASITAEALTVIANGDGRVNLLDGGEGGSGLPMLLPDGPTNEPILGNAGNGSGGIAGLAMAAGTLDIGDLLFEASGFGGASAAATGDAPYLSGSGFGGTSRFAQTGGTVNATSLQLVSGGLGGGSGASAAEGELAALAGSGSGGTASLQLGGGGSLTVQDASLVATGAGGTGMSHAAGGEASDGGAGTGGSALLESEPGWAGSFTAGSLSLRGNGAGGAGGASEGGAAGGGGQGTGTVASILLADGQFALGSVTVDATGIGGGSGDASSGLAGAEGGEARGGEARFALVDSIGPAGTRSMGELIVDSSGRGGAGSQAIAAGYLGEAALTVSALGTAPMVTGNASIYNSGLREAGSGGIAAAISGVPFTVGGDLMFSTDGSIDIAAAQPLRAGGTVTMAGNGFTSTGLLASGGAMDISGAAGIAADRLESGAATLLRAPNGGLTVSDLASAGAVTARALDIDVRSNGGLSFAEATASAGGVTIVAGDFLTTQAVSATGLAELRAGGTLRAQGNVSGGTIVLAAGGDVIADDLASEGALTVDAGGLFALGGTASGSTVTVTSADIDLAGDARLGVRGVTSELTIFARAFEQAESANRIFVGGAARSDSYSLDGNEAERLFADEAILFQGLDGGEGGITDLVIGDLALSFGANGNIGTGGSLEISSPGEIAVTGAVALATSGADDTFRIDPTRVELDTSSGSIALLGAGGTPFGRLEIVGDTIAVATTGTLAQLRTLTGFAAINAALDQPGGDPQALRAGTIVFDVTDALFIQNSGVSTDTPDRRGFLAGGVEIHTTSNATRIAINGQLLAQGTTVSGLDVIPLVSINDAAAAAGGTFDPASTINGCAIGTDCLAVPEPPRLDTPGLPSDADLHTPLDPDESDGGGSLFVAPLIELAPAEPLISPPLVDEPITGVGNDDLWEPACDPSNESCSEEDEAP